MYSMNKVIDVSEVSTESQMDLFTTAQQDVIKAKLSTTPFLIPIVETQIFDDIVDKFSHIDGDNTFLTKVMKEIQDLDNVNKQTKGIYLHILHCLLNHCYLFDEDDDENSEGDYTHKLYSTIMENTFEDSGIRLRWGETMPVQCKNFGYHVKIDMRVTVPSKAVKDLSVVEFAKAYSIEKHFKDKAKGVLCALHFFKIYSKSYNVDSIPFALISRLEGTFYVLRRIEDGWFIVEEVNDFNIPHSVKELKDGAIHSYISKLYQYKNLCRDLKIKTSEPHRSKRTTSVDRSI